MLRKALKRMSINHERHPKKENSPTITTALQSDNDANERPVREKLRETSIAPKIDSDCLSNQDITSPEKSLLGDYASTSGIVTAVLESSPCVDGSRGRPGKKRSFDEFERVGNTKITNSEQCKDGSTGHSRKRSREVQKMSTAVTKTPSEHGNEEGLDRSNILLDEAHFTSPLSAVVQPENDKKSELGEEREDLVLGDATFSPRKKRSREQVDTDIQREQKIVATEEAKANRGSDEIQRTEKRSQKADISTEPLTETFTANPSTSPAATPAAIPKEALRKSETGKLNSSSLTEAPVVKSTAGESSAAQKENPPSAPTSKAAFSRSGLAAFSQNSTSGFGELGSSSALRAGRNAFSAQSTDFVGLGKQNTTDGAAVASIGSFGSQEPSAFPTASATGSLGPSPFGAPAFGSAFGAQGTFGSNSAMRSFAASNGDVSLGRSKSKPSTFGAPEGEDEENDDAGSDNEGDGASESGEEAPTSTTKFQQKEGTQFTSKVFVKPANATQLIRAKKARSPSTSLVALACTVSPMGSGESVARVSSSSMSRQTAATVLPTAQTTSLQGLS